MPTPASPAGTWCNHTLERKRSTLGRSSGEAFGLAAASYLALSGQQKTALRYGRFADFSGITKGRREAGLCPPDSACLFERGSLPRRAPKAGKS